MKSTMIGKEFKLHIGNSTAILMSVTPIYAIVELFVLNMAELVSLKARLITILITYLGLGFLFAKGRNISKRIFNVSEEFSHESTIVVHDLLYLVGFNFCLTPLLYLVSGASPREIVLGTSFALGMAFIAGPINGFFIDAAGELTGLNSSLRLPVAVRQLDQASKTTILFGVLMLVLLGLGFVYWIQFDSA